MATVWWLVLPPYSLSFFHSSLFISAISPFEDPSWPLWATTHPPPSPPTALHFHPCLPLPVSLPLWKTKWKKKKAKRQQTTAETMFWWSINDATSKCVCFSRTKMRRNRGRFNIKGPPPPPPVRCEAQGEWKSLTLFCYQLSSVSLQMNCWYRLMSYNPSPLIFCRFLAASLPYVSPVCVSLTGSHYITKQPHLPLYLY